MVSLTLPTVACVTSPSMLRSTAIEVQLSFSSLLPMSLIDGSDFLRMNIGFGESFGVDEHRVVVGAVVPDGNHHSRLK